MCTIGNVGKFFRPVLIFLTALLCVSCAGSGGGRQEEGSARREITVTVPPLAFFARAIGGDSIMVSTLLPAGTDPETFQPGMEAMRALHRSAALAVTGVLPFEKEMLSNLRANNGELRVADMSEGMSLLYGTHSHIQSSCGDTTVDPHTHLDADPHIWSSVANARVIARNTARALGELYPGLASYFTQRCDSLVQRLDSLDSSYASRLAGRPAFVIWHPSLSYLARDYSLEQIALNLENKETSPRRLREITDYARGRSPQAFIVPAGLNPERVHAVASAIDLQPVEVNFMSDDWEGEMNRIVNSLAPLAR